MNRTWTQRRQPATWPAAVAGTLIDGVIFSVLLVGPRYLLIPSARRRL